MKKFIIGLMLCVFLAIPNSVLAKVQTKQRVLEDSNGVELTNFSLTSGVAVFSEAVDVQNNIGFFTLILTENIGGGAGDVDVSVQYSVDGTNWYVPETFSPEP